MRRTLSNRPSRRAGDEESGRRRGGGAVTLRHVAALAGVAPITVSRAFNAPASVSAPLRRQIEAAVAELGYVPNRFAGALASSESRIVPVIVPSLSNAVFIEVVQGVQEVLESEGYQLLLANTQYDLRREADLVATLLGWSPPGVILAGLRHDRRTRQLLHGYNRPVVEVMEYGPRPIDMNVGLSHLKAGETMAEHLIARGYRQIGFVGGRLAADYRAWQRYKGLDRGLERAGLARRPAFAHDEVSSGQLGGDKLIEALARDPRLDALFFANDDLAVGAILRAQREGLAVPGRIAIAGFNGLPLSRLTNPPLTTIVSPRQTIGALAARKLLLRVQGRPSGPRRTDVGYRLEIGGST